MNTEDNFMTIPKPKFKVGDRVETLRYGKLVDSLCTITSSLYSFERQEWGYGAKDYTNTTYQQKVHYIYNLACWESNLRLAKEGE